MAPRRRPRCRLTGKLGPQLLNCSAKISMKVGSQWICLHPAWPGQVREGKPHRAVDGHYPGSLPVSLPVLIAAIAPHPNSPSARSGCLICSDPKLLRDDVRNSRRNVFESGLVTTKHDFFCNWRTWAVPALQCSHIVSVWVEPNCYTAKSLRFGPNCPCVQEGGSAEAPETRGITAMVAPVSLCSASGACGAVLLHSSGSSSFNCLSEAAEAAAI